MTQTWKKGNHGQSIHRKMLCSTTSPCIFLKPLVLVGNEPLTPSSVMNRFYQL